MPTTLQELLRCQEALLESVRQMEETLKSMLWTFPLLG